MGSPLGPTLANAFLVYQEKNWIEHYPLEYRPLYHRRYVDIFVLLNSAEHLKRFHSYLKLVSAIFYQIFIFPPNDSPLKTMKNAFYFI